MDRQTRQKHQALVMLIMLGLAGLGLSIALITSGHRRLAIFTPETMRHHQLEQTLRQVELLLPVISDSLHGQLTDTLGVPMSGVTVSDGYDCTRTDSAGHYALKRHTDAHHIFYTVPADCAVPVHSDSDRTACFYLPITEQDSVYNFVLTRLPHGKETRYKLIVLGDPQITNTDSPYYTGPNNDLVAESDLHRFYSETMQDISATIDGWEPDTPVYGLSMGDDVQYYGGYNDSLEYAMRRALGSARMTVFSVIGNHDQDGKKVYRDKWEEAWGPTDFSFDRGDEHYVCFNDCDFYHGGLYYSPGELSDKQMSWLRQDLALTDTTKKVILCYHIPLTFGNRPNDTAQPLDIPSEEGHYSSSKLGALLELLQPFKGGFELFCGHTHFAINHEIDFEGQHLIEHCHAAACGTIWQANINICGTPNGYYVYDMDGTAIRDSRYKATRWDPDSQITLFHADTDFNKESYANDWDLPRDEGVLIANVFNANSRWKVMAVENGVEHPMTRISSLGQDAFATGYLHKYAKSVNYWFVSKRNTYLIMNHLYYYKPQSPTAVLMVTATDPYGHTFTASGTQVVTQPFFNYAHYYPEDIIDKNSPGD